MAKSTNEQKRAKGQISLGVINGSEVFLPIVVSKHATRIKNKDARAQFLADLKNEYVTKAQSRPARNPDANNPIAFEVSPRGRAVLKQTGTQRWAFLSKEKLKELRSPEGLAEIDRVIALLPDEVVVEDQE